MSLLKTTGISKYFGGLKAVDNVDFSQSQGEVRALIGPNGAGKSTLVGLISGRVPATSGRVMFDGQDITALPAHRRICLGMAYTFQITSIFQNLDVEENVALAARRRWQEAPADLRARVWSAVSWIGLLDRMGESAGDLSYGHQRLLEIAMGLVQEPKLLILDEPTQGLAESEIREFIRLVNVLRERTTILLIEHNMDVVMETADQITVLDFGRILAQGTPEDIRANRDVQAAYLGTA